MELGYLFGAITQNARDIICGVMLCLSVVCAIAISILILMQKSSDTTATALSGIQDSYYGKNKKQNRDNILKLWTIILGVAIAVFCFVALLVMYVG